MDVKSLVHINGLPTHLLHTLTYALFRPLSKDQDLGTTLSAQLLLDVERDLRALGCSRRHRAVLFANLGLFVIALALSIEIALGNLTEITPFPLSLGLLLSWLPLLVVFSLQNHRHFCPDTW